MEKNGIRASIRKWSMRAAITLVLFVASTVLGGFLTAYAAEQGWYDNPSQQISAMIGALQSVLANDWFQVIASLIVGFAIGVRLDSFLKAGDGKPAPETRAELKVRYPHTSIFPFIDKGFEREAAYGKEHYREKIIDVARLFDGNFHIDRIIFEDCIMAGPAVLSLNNSHLYDCGFLHEISAEEIYIEISDERAQHMITCGHQFVECTFRRCKFYRVSFIGTTAALAPIRHALGERK